MPPLPLFTALLLAAVASFAAAQAADAPTSYQFVGFDSKGALEVGKGVSVTCGEDGSDAYIVEIGDTFTFYSDITYNLNLTVHSVVGQSVLTVASGVGGGQVGSSVLVNDSFCLRQTLVCCTISREACPGPCETGNDYDGGKPQLTKTKKRRRS